MTEESHDNLIRITADDREQGAGVVKALRERPGIDLRVKRLALGDYIADSHLIFERKTLVDLVASIKDKRLFSQACRLRGTAHPVIILEGKTADLQGSGMRRQSIQGALISLTLILGIPVLRSLNPVETAQLMVFAARQIRTAASGAYPRGGCRPQGKARTQHHILQGLPGIGPGRARLLLEAFETVEAIMSADEKQLAAINGIGRTTARKIRWALNDPAGNYVVG